MKNATKLTTSKITDDSMPKPEIIPEKCEKIDALSTHLKEDNHDGGSNKGK